MASRSHSAGATCANWHTGCGGLCALLLLVVIGAVSACQEPRELPGLDPKTDDLPGQDSSPPLNGDDAVDDGPGLGVVPGDTAGESPPAVPEPQAPDASGEPDADVDAGTEDADAGADPE